MAAIAQSGRQFVAIDIAIGRSHGMRIIMVVIAGKSDDISTKKSTRG
jgi:uncharacterized phosphosugar-binding protein